MIDPGLRIIVRVSIENIYFLGYILMEDAGHTVVMCWWRI